jgi:ketosteroid isomerase-like protein
MRGTNKRPAWILCVALIGTFAPPLAAALVENVEIADFGPLERAWDDAYLAGDVDALDALWSDDIILVFPGTKPIQKWHALDLAKSGHKTLARYETRIELTSVWSNTAVVTGSMRVARKTKGGERVELWRFMKTYSLYPGGKWRVLGFIATLAPGG